MAAPQKKKKIKLLNDLAISLMGIYPKELKTESEERFWYPCSEQHYSQ